MSDEFNYISQLNKRSQDIFRHLVESFLKDGEPVGSRTLSRSLPISLSPASVRNVMSDLEHLGLITSPHTSAGRIPTQTGLRMFVDGMLEFGTIDKDDQRYIERHIAQNTNLGHKQNVDDLLAETGNILSGLSQCAGIVLTSKQSRPIQHIQFVRLDSAKVLLILVYQDNEVENRILTVPAGLPASALEQASNYLNAHVVGLTIAEAEQAIAKDMEAAKQNLDVLTSELVASGVATWSSDNVDERNLIVRGRSNLIGDGAGFENLNLIKQLFDDLEAKKELVNLLDLADNAEG
ncbi:MAG: heat-inducible transcription repressor HrcA, partial [Rhizobiales bacterium]|nr:heat-inducible transcription repressor HrcA [Hyphomicrobiales bacterium]